METDLRTLKIGKKLVKYMYILLAILFIVLAYTSITTKHTSYLKANTKHFLTELLFLGIITAIPVFTFVWTRNLPRRHTLYLVLMLALKLTLMHVLLELSGFYHYAFHYKMKK